jgi:hypothetical protein
MVCRSHPILGVLSRKGSPCDIKIPASLWQRPDTDLKNADFSQEPSFSYWIFQPVSQVKAFLEKTPSVAP